MRTLEEVRKHLSEVVYNNVEDRAFIAGFLRGEGLYENWDNPLDFAEYEENDLTDFFAWWDKANEEDEEEEKETPFNIESLIDYIVKDAESNGIKVSRFTIEEDADELEYKLKKLNEKSKKERDDALAELDKAEKELEKKIESMSDPKLQKLAKSFLGFAKELKEETKKKMNA